MSCSDLVSVHWEEPEYQNMRHQKNYNLQVELCYNFEGYCCFSKVNFCYFPVSVLLHVDVLNLVVPYEPSSPKVFAF